MVYNILRSTGVHNLTSFGDLEAVRWDGMEGVTAPIGGGLTLNYCQVCFWPFFFLRFPPLREGGFRLERPRSSGYKKLWTRAGGFPNQLSKDG